MREPEFTAVIFDAEGVVLDTEPMWDAVQSRLLSRRGAVYDRDAVKHLLTGRAALAAVTALAEAFDLPDDPADLVAERHEIMRACLSEGVPYIPGFVEETQDLRRRFPTAVATSMDPALLDIPAVHAALDPLFADNVYSATREGLPPKPAPDIFLYAAASLGAKPAECLVVEDAPSGIRAAKAAGMHCLALTTTHSAHHLAEADVVVPTWAAARAWVEGRTLPEPRELDELRSG